MANPQARLKVAELDFDTIKDNLKNFLKSQDEFSDYNFEGSGLSVLLDLLAYNTHYMGYYLNMVSNEMFIDTAIKRGSVVSHAKLLGYVPRSRIAARAAVNVTVTPVAGDSNSSITIPRFTRFISESKDGINYMFVNPSARVVTKNTSTGLFVAENVEIKEGQPNAITFTYNAATNTKQVFVIPDTGIDTSTLQVMVQQSAENANQQSYILSQDATNVDSTALVYYLEENKDGKYQVYFGDGVVGKALTDGNIVVLSYLITSGPIANNLKEFKLADIILPNGSAAVTLANESSSGALEEDVEKIRFTAPKAYISQNRAVTKNDYIALLNRDYPYFEAVNVWGGEDNVPPVYGKVFFTAKPLGGYEITTAEINNVINNIIKPFSVLTVLPEYVPADYNYINMSVSVNFDPTRTNKTANEINSTVLGCIRNFANTNLNTFNSSFKISQLQRAIDDCDSSITSNDVNLTLEKRFTPDTTKAASYVLNYGTEIKQGTIVDKIYSTPSFEYYDSANTLRKCYLEEVLQSFTGVESIDIVTSGAEFVTTPTVTIEGDGVGATAKALIVNGVIKKVEVTNPGTGYTSATVTVSDGGGYGASLKANLQGRMGRLKIYYFDENKIKKTITENAGTIDYKLGIITLDNFNPVSVSDPFGTLVIKVPPLKKIFSSIRNTIITLDITDPGSIITSINSVVE